MSVGEEVGKRVSALIASGILLYPIARHKQERLLRKLKRQEEIKEAKRRREEREAAQHAEQQAHAWAAYQAARIAEEERLRKEREEKWPFIEISKDSASGEVEFPKNNYVVVDQYGKYCIELQSDGTLIAGVASPSKQPNNQTWTYEDNTFKSLQSGNYIAVENVAEELVLPAVKAQGGGNSDKIKKKWRIVHAKLAGLTLTAFYRIELYDEGKGTTLYLAFEADQVEGVKVVLVDYDENDLSQIWGIYPHRP